MRINKSSAGSSGFVSGLSSFFLLLLPATPSSSSYSSVNFFSSSRLVASFFLLFLLQCVTMWRWLEVNQGSNEWSSKSAWLRSISQIGFLMNRRGFPLHSNVHLRDISTTDGGIMQIFDICSAFSLRKKRVSVSFDVHVLLRCLLAFWNLFVIFIAALIFFPPFATRPEASCVRAFPLLLLRLLFAQFVLDTQIFFIVSRNALALNLSLQ